MQIAVNKMLSRIPCVSCLHVCIHGGLIQTFFLFIKIFFFTYTFNTVKPDPTDYLKSKYCQLEGIELFSDQGQRETSEPNRAAQLISCRTS